MSGKSYKYAFEDLVVWKESRDLTIKIYETTGKFPKEELFGLTSQIRRCSISIASNIAEGSAKSTKSEQSRYYDIAYGSAIEMLNQLIIAKGIGYLSESELENFRQTINSITYLLYKLKKSLDSSSFLREPPSDYGNFNDNIKNQ